MFEKKSLVILLTGWILSHLFILLSTSIAAAVEEKSLTAQALALQSRYSSLTSLTFSFDQVTHTGTREREGNGKAIFYRFRPPVETGNDEKLLSVRSVMRWNYTAPDPQVIVSDGQTLSIYTEKDRQLIRTPASELESDITYAFFAGTRSLLDDFTIEPAEPSFILSSGTDLQTLLLVPRKPHNQIRDVQVWFDREGIIHHLKVTDHFDSLTELNFTDIRINSLPAGDRKTLEGIINFPVPPGTEIISR